MAIHKLTIVVKAGLMIFSVRLWLENVQNDRFTCSMTMMTTVIPVTKHNVVIYMLRLDMENMTLEILVYPYADD